jgi:hypothetical protein
MPNGKRDSKGFNPLEDPKILRDQLYRAQKALFFAKTVREAKVLQDRINFLRQKMKDMENNKKK